MPPHLLCGKTEWSVPFLSLSWAPSYTCLLLKSPQGLCSIRQTMIPFPHAPGKHPLAPRTTHFLSTCLCLSYLLNSVTLAAVTGPGGTFPGETRASICSPDGETIISKYYVMDQRIYWLYSWEPGWLKCSCVTQNPHQHGWQPMEVASLAIPAGWAESSNNWEAPQSLLPLM